MRKQLLYKDLARYYDLIYSWKDYKRESKKIGDLVKIYKKSKGKDMLEIACGTGKHISYLKKDFRIIGTDINNQMLTIARRQNKGAIFRKADMVNFNLRKQFDVILCLFSSIGYVKSYSDLGKTLANLSKHLKQGGVVLIEPWLTKSVYKAGLPGMTTYDGKEIKIARLNASKILGDTSVMDMHYLIAEKGKEVRYFTDRHELGMFEVSKFLKLMRGANLDAKFLKNGLMKNRGLYIGVKK